MKSIYTMIALAACTLATQAQTTLSIKGSDTLGAHLVPQLAEAFKAAGNNVKFEIAAEGSSTAFPALANGTAQIGMSSRKAKSDEITFCKTKGIFLKSHTACYDMMAVIVNKNNPIANLTKAQVAKLFTGSIKDWSEVGGRPGAISAYTRNTSSGTYKDWQKLAMGGRDYGANCQKMAGNEQIAEEVSKNPNGVGYVGHGYINKPGIKVVTIDGMAPEVANVKTFPYSRPCFYYAPDKPTEAAAKFLEFALSKQGEEVVRRSGFIPVSDVE